MKILKTFALLALASTIQMKADPDCMDNSWHLEKANDNKEYHIVQCNCPCAKRHKILADRGMCSQCGHFRDPKPFIIMPSKAKKQG